MKFLNDQRGLVQIPVIIGLLIMAVAVPVATKLVEQNQDTRQLAAGSAPGCPAGTVSQRTYGECCGCGKAKEVRECTMSDGRKEYYSSGCEHDAPGCTNGCSQPTNPPAAQPTNPPSSGQICNSVGQSCKDENYSEACGNGGTRICNKYGTCTGIGGGDQCSWGPGSYCGACSDASAPTIPPYNTPAPTLPPGSNPTAPPTSTCGRLDQPCCLTEYVLGKPVYNTCNSPLICRSGKCAGPVGEVFYGCNKVTGGCSESPSGTYTDVNVCQQNCTRTPTATPTGANCDGGRVHGQAWCDGNRLKKCDNGVIRTLVNECENGCENGACRTTKLDIRCDGKAENTTECNSNGTSFRRCTNVNGTGQWIDRTCASGFQCPAGEPYCRPIPTPTPQQGCSGTCEFGCNTSRGECNECDRTICWSDDVLRSCENGKIVMRLCAQTGCDRGTNKCRGEVGVILTPTPTRRLTPTVTTTPTSTAAKIADCKQCTVYEWPEGKADDCQLCASGQHYNIGGIRTDGKYFYCGTKEKCEPSPNWMTIPCNVCQRGVCKKGINGTNTVNCTTEIGSNCESDVDCDPTDDWSTTPCRTCQNGECKFILEARNGVNCTTEIGSNCESNADCATTIEHYSCNRTTGQCGVDSSGPYTMFEQCKNNCTISTCSICQVGQTQWCDLGTIKQGIQTCEPFSTAGINPICGSWGSCKAPATPTVTTRPTVTIPAGVSPTSGNPVGPSQTPTSPASACGNKTDVTGATNPGCCSCDSDCPSGQKCNIPNGYCQSGFSCNPNPEGKIKKKCMWDGSQGKNICANAPVMPGESEADECGQNNIDNCSVNTTPIPTPTGGWQVPTVTVTSAPVAPTNPPSGGCAYSSLKSRVHRDESQPWVQALTVNERENVIIGCISGDSVELADNVSVVITRDGGGEERFSSNRTTKVWSTATKGRYTVKCVSDDSRCNGLQSDNSVVNVVSTACGNECPSDFVCYKNGDDYKWFAQGFEMNGYVRVDSGCQIENKPSFLGKAKGDANCDGKIDIVDRSVWTQEYISIQGRSITRSDWASDFNCDNLVDINDRSIWTQYYRSFNQR